MTRKLPAGWLVLGAALMTAVAVIIGIRWFSGVVRPADATAAFVVLGGWAVGHFAVMSLVIIDARRLVEDGDLDALQRSADHLKRATVWFFGCSFVGLGTVVATTLSSGVHDRGGGAVLDGVPLLVLLVLLSYLVLLPTSAYGVATLVVLRRSRQVGVAFFRINLVSQLLFATDVLSTVLVVELARHLLGNTRAPGRLARNLLTVVLGLCSVLATAWFVLVILTAVLPAERGSLLPVDAVLLFTPPLGLVLIVIVPAVPIVSFRACLRLCLLGDLDLLPRIARRAKLIAIPFFVQNFLLTALIVAAFTLFPVVASRGLVVLTGPFAVPIVGAFSAAGFVPTVVGTYLIMLVTSLPGIALTTVLLRRHLVSKGFGVTNLILHLIFVTDIVSTLVVAVRARRQPRVDARIRPRPAVRVD